MSLRRTTKHENRRTLRAGPRPAAGHGKDRPTDTQSVPNGYGPRREQSYKVIF